MPDSVAWAISNFRVDRVTAEVTRELAARSIETILLKGPSIATWLYSGSDRPRLYGDSDLLIRRRDWEPAQTAMRELGFHDALGPLAHPRMESGAGHPWKRQEDAAEVDLHYTLFGITVDADSAWSRLTVETDEQTVGGAVVRTLSRPARLVHVALHAVQHGAPGGHRPMIDLERALAVASGEDWAQAAEVADEVGATEAFVTGLELTPEGRALVGRLGIRTDSSVDAALRIQSVPMAEGFEELSRVRGWRAKLRLLAREALPSPAFMRWWHPLARRGPAGLALAYLWRFVWLVGHAIPGFIGWRRARRAGARKPG